MGDARDPMHSLAVGSNANPEEHHVHYHMAEVPAPVELDPLELFFHPRDSRVPGGGIQTLTESAASCIDVTLDSI